VGVNCSPLARGRGGGAFCGCFAFPVMRIIGKSILRGGLCAWGGLRDVV
jgi:hypothetical protein